MTSRATVIVRNYIHSIQTEIGTDACAYAFGFCLVASHGAVLLFFVNVPILANLLKEAEPLCWPYFEDCWRYRLESLHGLALLALGYGGLIGAAALALARGYPRVFWITMMALNLGLAAVVSMDYRFRANEFYMLFWINGVYLVLPHRRWTVPAMIVSFYFWAGVLKLNYEWLSGAALYRPLFLIPERFNFLACSYVVVLETVLIWGVLAERRTVVAVIVTQILIFHVQSLSQIHWFYPLLMGTMLAWFGIQAACGGQSASLGQLVRFRAPRSTYCLLGVFGALQVAPLLYSGDRVLTGEGRLLALHMFEARQQCQVSALLRRVDGLDEMRDLQVRSLPPRSVCDPVIYFDRVSNLCRSRSVDHTLIDVDFRMRVRRMTDAEYTTIVDVASFCDKGYSYSLLWPNKWIRAERSGVR